MANSNQTEGQGFLRNIGAGLTNWTEKWIPDSFVIVLILSMIAYVLALIWGFGKEIGFADRLYGGIEAWGKGFWVYLAFAM
jgi:short-chain fatty acids transporter